MRDDLVLGMAGSGGDGVVSAGESLIAAAAATGYHAMLTIETLVGERQRDLRASAVPRERILDLFAPR